ncbi:MAG: response regulator [Myxococcota bacterium]
MNPILVVDDSQTVREFVKIYLMDLGYEFVEADTGARALQLARLMAFDLVIADVKMPEMDGFTMVRQLRADPDVKSKQVPVILLTGEKGAMMRVQSLNAGANAFLPKPIETEKLRELARQLLGLAPAGKAVRK